MSHNLWRSLLEDDVDSFRQYLANATYTSAAPRTPSGFAGGNPPKIGSPGTLATSPRVQLKSRKSSGNVHTASGSRRSGGLLLTRAELNGKDSFGRTLLHHAVSKRGSNAHDFVKALLEVPYVDLYAQDTESGWTALHRALYFGSISSAQALMQRDIQDATDYTTTAAHTHAGGLVKIKDNEGNSPFEVFGLTIAPRGIQTSGNSLPAGPIEDDGSNSVDLNDDAGDAEKLKRLIRPRIVLHGDAVFAFGSNKNLTLGTGDEDDRHFPERSHFTRPDHLLLRLHEDYLLARQKTALSDDLTASSTFASLPDTVPALIKHKAITIQDVAMSKLHTAVLTTDPISNLHICGFGPGGRLGTGDEATLFSYKCIQGGGLAKRHVSTIALGQDHTIAICSQGEVFTWGSNRYGQLGYSLPEVSAKEVPMQLLPRQLYGLIKKELFIGAAASATHSAIYTSSALYTFGKNEGQLGLMDADARSLEIQTLPRRVAPSVLQAPIRSVSAIDRATTVLLETHDVIVFTHYGWTKVAFQLEGFTPYFPSETMTTRYDLDGNYIQKVTSGGSTICAMSSYGEAFTIEVPKAADSVPSNVSTTNPTKARNALPAPARVWSIRKSHMSAMDVAVGQDGSIILCTTSGSVWRKEKRANIKTVRSKDAPISKPKDYKFVRVPNLTRAVAVRSNAYGAFTAIRKDADVTREQVLIDPVSLWSDIFPLLSFCKYGENEEDETTSTPQLRFWRPTTNAPSPIQIKRAIILQKDSEVDILQICRAFEPLAKSRYDAWITSNVTEVRIPIHAFLLKARSKVMRAAFKEFQETYYFEIPDLVAVEYGQDGQIQIQFQGADFLTIANLALYLYTDEIIDVWHFTSKALQSAARYRAVRTELMRIASQLELRQLERAVRLMINPVKSLSVEMELAVTDPDLFSDADITIELSDGVEQPAHSVLLCARCPFFKGLFDGRAGGIWMSSRRGVAEENSDVPRVDLKHIDSKVFQIVLRHLYADTGAELFNDVVTNDFEEFTELVLEVMAVANELMIDRLAQICQSVLGKFVTLKNVCHLLNAVAECSVNEFKQAALEYVCLNLESMLEQRLLEELDPELLSELDGVVQANQVAFMPFARSNRAQQQLLEEHPELTEQLEEGRQRRIDSMQLRSRLVEDEQRSASYQKFRVGSIEAPGSTVGQEKRTQRSKDPSPGQSPFIAANDMGDELPFEMDEDTARRLPSAPACLPSPNLVASQPAEGEQLSSSLSRTPDLSRSFLRDTDEEHVAFATSRSPVSSIPSSPTANFSYPGGLKAPWQSSPQVSNRVDLKNIMDQASASRVSGITQSIPQSEVFSRPAQKVSQKERKKQSHRQKTEDAEAQSQSISTIPNSPGMPQSPWRRVGQSKAQSSGSSTSTMTHSAAPLSSPHDKPAVPMQPTVARESTPSSRPAPKPIRSSSSPTAASSTKPAPPIIQSIRHTPAPTRSASGVDARTSMAEILAQQQTEKTAVKEAVAKRSLQEIQQEQEFQEWWDKESRRVQEEESHASAATGRRGKGGRGRGRGRGSWRGGAARIASNDGQDKMAAQASTREQTRGAAQGNSRGEGSRAGRGRIRGT